MRGPQQDCHPPAASCAQENDRHAGLRQSSQHSGIKLDVALENDALDEPERNGATTFAAFVNRKRSGAVTTELEMTAVED
jgi:hypothetical protein